MWKVYFKIALCLLLAESTHGVDCPRGWTYYDEYCYFYNAENYSFFDARALCDMLGAEVAEPDSEAKNNFIKDLVTGHGGDKAWIGLVDFVVENEFVWLSSGETPAAGSTRWEGSEPNNNGDQDCTIIVSSGLWWDLDCTEVHHTVCQKRATGEGVVG